VTSTDETIMSMTEQEMRAVLLILAHARTSLDCDRRRVAASPRRRSRRCWLGSMGAASLLAGDGVSAVVA
jgi:transposase